MQEKASASPGPAPSTRCATAGTAWLRHPGGQQPGEVHINGLINGAIELIPDDASLATYAGAYREKVNGIATEFTDEGDIERIGQYRLRSTLHGTDGSSLKLSLSGKLTFNANGVVTVERETFTCE